MDKLVRIQDKEGRGPYRPGFSHRWVDRTNTSLPPNYMEEFGEGIIAQIQTAKQNGFHYGCGFRTLKQLQAWFTKSELKRLKPLGYSIVEILVDEVIAESDHQVVFLRKLPLHEKVKPIP